jgi:hypothetical protein
MIAFEKLLAAFGWTTQPTQTAARIKGDDLNAMRALVRKRQRLQDAFIFSDKMIRPRHCTLLNMTPLGGAVEIWDETLKDGLLNGEVTLYLPADRKEVVCAVKWRRENSIGLSFVSAMREPTRAYR